MKVGDRLEPTCELQDIGKLAQVNLPRKVILWRATMEGKYATDPVSHRNPLFSAEIYSSPVSRLAVDQRPTVSLGIVRRAISAALWRVLLFNCTGFTGSLEKVLESGIKLMKADLALFQSDPKNGVDPARKVSTLTLKMLGKRKGYNLQDRACFLSGVLSASSRSFM